MTFHCILFERTEDGVEKITPNAATNEREGSEIARQIVGVLLDKRIKMFFVTHMYEFACGIFDQKMEQTFFLRAERQSDGMRTFKLLEGEPLQTS